MDHFHSRPALDTFLYWLFLASTVTGLYLTTKVSYLLFHSIAELFSIIIAGTVFIITWKSVQYIRNPYLIMVGISYLFIGFLDLLHTLSYTGMRIFVDYDYYANQLWVAARYMESITLLVAFILLATGRQARAGHLFALYLAITSLLVASIFYWKNFPICFIEGKGLTPFKIYSEYLICSILAISFYFLARNRRFFSDRIFLLLLLSIVFAIGSELCFTIYISNYGMANLVGHYFKLFSFLMIYQAIVATGIEEPYLLVFAELNQANESLRRTQEALTELNRELETRVKERTAELHEKDQLLMVQSRQAAMGEMINNIAHQWRQPLNSLSLLVQSVELSFEHKKLDQKALGDFVATGLKLINHMSRTVDDFRNFFKPEKEKVAFSVKEVAERTLSLVRGTFKEQGISVDLSAETDPAVLGYPNELSQVLVNILVNGKDVLVERKVVAPQLVVTVTEAEGKAVITVTDNAGGIKEEIMQRIFEHYFTTKGPEGTGLGLSMSKTIVEKSLGGRLSVRNVENGAEFRIELPKHKPPSAAKA